MVPFAKSDLFVIIPKNSKTKKMPVILGLAHDLSVPEKAQCSSLFLDIQDLPTVGLSCFLDQFTSIFNAGNHSVKFQELKISREHSPCNQFRNISTVNQDGSQF